MWVSQKRRGFTIVELLIVVIVIAILATIGVVSYNGVRTEAQNTRVIAAVKNYADVLNAYHLANNEYPNVGGDYVCLPASYPATADFPVNSCEYDGTRYLNFVSTANATDIAAALGSVERSLPDASYGFKATGYSSTRTNERARGIIYTDDGGIYIVYHLKNETKCPLGTPETGPGGEYIACYYDLR